MRSIIGTDFHEWILIRPFFLKQFVRMLSLRQFSNVILDFFFYHTNALKTIKYKTNYIYNTFVMENAYL